MAVAMDEALSHFGVKGMKWGVRKEDVNTAVSSLSRRNTDPTKKKFNKDIKTAGGLHGLSDADLKKKLNRLEMEKKYSKMLAEDSERRKAGLLAVGKILGEVGKVALPVLLEHYLKNKGGASSAANGVYRTTAVVQQKVIEGATKQIGG